MISKRNQLLVQKVVSSLYTLRVLPIFWNYSKSIFELNHQDCSTSIPVFSYLHIFCSTMHIILLIYHLIIKDVLFHLLDDYSYYIKLTMIEVGLIMYHLIFHCSSLFVMTVFVRDLDRVPMTLNFVQRFACKLNGKTFLYSFLNSNC